MSMYTDIDWEARKQKIVLRMLTEYARRFTRGHWSFLEPGSEKIWYGTHVFRAASALEKGELKSKGKGVKSIRCNGSADTIELILRTIISVNQLSVNGAVADSRGTAKLAAMEKCESMVKPTEFLIANLMSQTDAEVQGNLLREHAQKFAELPEQEK